MTYEPIWKSKSQTWSRLKDAARGNRKAPTAAEAALWNHLRSRQLAGMRFRRQHALGPYIVDFYCAAANLVIEVDGPIHTQRIEQDEARTGFLEMLGLKVLRFTNKEVSSNLQQVLSAIEAASAIDPNETHKVPPLRGDGEGARG